MYRRFLALLAAATMAQTVAGAEGWTQFRGPDGNGVSPAVGLPLDWSETWNVRWKVAIPGRGHSSPVVMGERIWMTTAVDTATEQVVLGAVCLDRDSGNLLYHRELFRLEKPEPVHGLNSYATPTPVVEPGRLYCDFGALGTACLDAATGEIIWRQRLPVEHQVGPGSSPVLWRDLLLLVRDGCDAQYVAALETGTGQIAWKTDRPEIKAESGDFKKSFSTPLIIDVEGRPQAIVPGAHWIVSYDPATGRPIWQVRHGTGYSLAPRPVAGHGMLYTTTGGYVPQLWAIRVDGRRDVSDTHVVWRATKQIPLMSSPLLVGEELYIVSDNGIATCFDALTGETHWRERLGGAYAASPVYVDGRIYLFSREGKTTVLKPGKQFTPLAESQIQAAVTATPAPVGQSIFLRTEGHLYRIEE